MIAGIAQHDVHRIIAFVRETQRIKGFKAYPPAVGPPNVWVQRRAASGRHSTFSTGSEHPLVRDSYTSR